jgi:hypothetical protein
MSGRVHSLDGCVSGEPPNFREFADDSSTYTVVREPAMWPKLFEAEAPCRFHEDFREIRDTNGGDTWENTVLGMPGLF